MDAARGAAVDALSVVVTGFRLALRHLPTLLVIYLFGAAARHGVLWASVELSASHSTLAGLLLPLAPMSTLTAIVLMLRVVSSELEWASFGSATSDDGGYLALLASALIPFLTVYAAQGYLKQDLHEFINAATYDEIFGSAGSFYGESANLDRTFIATGVSLAGLVALALLLRFLLNRFDLPSRHVGFGVVAGYVEVLWLFLLAAQFTRYQARVWDWVTERKAVDWVEDRWSDVLSAAGPFKAPLDAVAHGIGNLLTDADAVVVVPIAWLTVGAVALGQRVEPPAPKHRPRAARLAQRVPPVVRRVSHEATADLRSRFADLGNGLRMLAVGGLLPMLMFCLVFIIARQAGALTVEVWRLIAGPASRDTALAFSPYVDVMSQGVYTLALVGLLAAAIDRVLANQPVTASPEPAGSSASSGSSA
ncbi:hypothetical protein GCM10022234_32160 [Aeromicrobium panaciterrae]|uniref:hypothetical protein n=1 Tax=Aeromicrobium panaciterrae TaxID=363861 RepID=UPI0031D808CF